MGEYYIAKIVRAGKHFTVTFPQFPNFEGMADSFSDAIDEASVLLRKIAQKTLFVNKALPAPVIFNGLGAEDTENASKDIFFQAVKVPGSEYFLKKLYITLRGDVYEMVENRAKDRNMSKSEYISICVQRMEEEIRAWPGG